MNKKEIENLSKEDLIKIALSYERQRNIIRKYQEENREKVLLACCKQTATRKGLDFDLDVSDIVIPELCPIMGVPLTGILGKGRQKYNASVDRIDSSKGYVKGNIQIISDLANRMKQNATTEELCLFAKGVLKLYEPGSIPTTVSSKEG